MDNYFFARIGSNKLHGPQTLRVRCETTMFNLYRGAAELDMEIVDDSWMLNGIQGYISGVGGIVSPTTDLRGNKNDPDNSALTGHGVRLGAKTAGVAGAAVLVLLSLSFVARIRGSVCT